MNKFGKTLRDVRKKMDLTLREVEKKGDVSRQTVLRAERGLFITPDTVAKLFDALRIKGTEAKELFDLYLKEHVLKKRRAA